MQLIVAVVQAADAQTACAGLVREGFRATRIRTVGGFLHFGNETLLIGAEDERLQQALDLVHACCHPRRQYVNLATSSVDGLPVHSAIEVQVGGATVFAVPVERLVRVGAEGTRDETRTVPHAAEKGANAMKLIITVVQKGLVDKVTDALLERGYRVTRIDTVGAFLRRGNGTLLIGVEADKVDEVVEIIRESTPPIGEALPASSGMPMYNATVFVLDAPTFVRM